MARVKTFGGRMAETLLNLARRRVDIIEKNREKKLILRRKERNARDGVARLKNGILRGHSMQFV